MQKDKSKSKNIPTQAESSQTKQATDSAIEQVTLLPKTSSSSPPKPNYPCYQVEPEKLIKLADFDADLCESYRKKKDIIEELVYQRDRLRVLQQRLYAENQRSLLIVLQAMDTGGKDGTIKQVFSGINPQGCRVWSFKHPSLEESNHDFLWRYHQHTPQKGMMTIFNRSHYEDVLIVRVKKLVEDEVWQKRYQIINDFEKMLTLSNITIIKFFLHISKAEQKLRLESRLENPDKLWKFSINDVNERLWWDDYQLAYQDAINNCSTTYAPWYVVPANKKWYRNLVIARAIADTLAAMNPQYPQAEADIKDIKIPD